MLCSHLARFVQEELDQYASYNRNFPPQSSRPRGVLIIVDRTIDLISPLVHEFTYQAMAHDLLPIKDGDKVTYRTLVNEGKPNQEMKDMEIGEHDRIWVDYRHMHMKDVLEKLADDFARFRRANAHFAEECVFSCPWLRILLTLVPVTLPRSLSAPSRTCWPDCQSFKKAKTPTLCT